jgi:hypothetical protein
MRCAAAVSLEGQHKPASYAALLEPAMRDGRLGCRVCIGYAKGDLALFGLLA